MVYWRTGRLTLDRLTLALLVCSLHNLVVEDRVEEGSRRNDVIKGHVAALIDVLCRHRNFDGYDRTAVSKSREKRQGEGRSEEEALKNKSCDGDVSN